MINLNWLVGMAVLSCVAANGSTVLINFETVPPLPTGPSLFGSSAEQTVTVPGVATISGGVVLGNEANLPAQSFGTPPNVYATAGFDSNLSSTLTIDLSPSFITTEVSFPLFNGATQTESYIANAFNGATQVATQTLSNLASNVDQGFGIFDLTASNITAVTIAPVTLNASCCSGWDYSIDSIALNEPVQAAFVPEPATLPLLCLGVAAILGLRRLKTQ